MNFNHDISAINLLTIDTTVPASQNANTQVLVIVGTGAVQLPLGTTLEQPAAAAGLIRFNTTTNIGEINDGNIWDGIITSTTESKNVYAVDANDTFTIRTNIENVSTRFIVNGIVIVDGIMTIL